MIPMDEFFRRSVDMAKSEYLRDPSKDGELMVYSESEDPDHNVLWGVSFRDNGEKLAIMSALRTCMLSRDTVRYSVMSLAWCTHKKDFGGRVMEDPDRIEILTVATKSAVTGDVRMGVYEVVRDQADHVSGYKNDQESDIGFGDMFDIVSAEIKKKFGKPPAQIAFASDMYLASSIITGRPVFVEDVMSNRDGVSSARNSGSRPH